MHPVPIGYSIREIKAAKRRLRAKERMMIRKSRREK